MNLLLWALFVRTPLNIEIEEWVERGVARHCKLSWEDYCQLKQTHAALWERYAAKRVRARAAGGFQPQPWQFRRWRKLEAPARAKLRRPRPRFTDWALQRLAARQSFKTKAMRDRALDRLFARLVGR